MPEPRGGGRPLLGLEVAFTGKLASLTRREAADLVERLGGDFSRSLGPRTAILVVGQEGWPLRDDGFLTRKLLRARALAAKGRPVEVLTEEEFLARLGLERPDGVHRLTTIAAASRVLRVPGDRLRLWMRLGILRPARVVHRLAYLDFREVAGAEAIARLIRAGVRPERVRRSLLALRSLWPDLDFPLAQLSLLDREGRLLVRLPDGGLAEPTGQRVFDFAVPADESTGSPPAIIDLEPRTAEGWFDLALRREEAGRLHEAVDAYREALLLEGPRPELCFNLGNALHSLGLHGEAAERFSQAVEMDPEYVEAWNNLGNALADLGRREKALDAYRRALAVLPGYGDAHYNLAEVLEELGLLGEARVHWRAYLEVDPTGAWADRARRRLARLG